MRYFGGALAFGFVAMWIMASLAAALVCLSAAVVAYGVVSVVELMRARSARRAKSSSIAASRAPVLTSRTPEAIPLWADALNSDLGHIYEPGATTSPLSREAEYGWPRDEDTVLTSGPLH